MFVKFQLSMSDIVPQILRAVLSAGPVTLQKRAWHIWRRFRCA